MEVVSKTIGLLIVTLGLSVSARNPLLRLSKALLLAFICFGGFFVPSGDLVQAQTSRSGTTILKGKIYRSDTNRPVANAKINMETHRETLEAKTDANGNYSFEQVKAGKYRVTISVRYNQMKDVPCTSTTGMTAEKESYINMKDEGFGYVDVWVYIDNFRIYSGKSVTKDFDVACRGFQRNSSKR